MKKVINAIDKKTYAFAKTCVKYFKKFAKAIDRNFI